jgi:hypothetical protein
MNTNPEVRIPRMTGIHANRSTPWKTAGETPALLVNREVQNVKERVAVARKILLPQVGANAARGARNGK